MQKLHLICLYVKAIIITTAASNNNNNGVNKYNKNIPVTFTLLEMLK